MIRTEGLGGVRTRTGAADEALEASRRASVEIGELNPLLAVGYSPGDVVLSVRRWFGSQNKGRLR